MYEFAKQVGYGLRTYNKEAGSSSTSSSTSSGMINIHQLALMLRGMPQGMDHPLAYAANSFQAFTVCLHVIYKYTSWRAYESNEPYYRWSPEIMPDAETTTLEFLEHHIEAVCKPHSENGLHLPPDLKLYAWIQLAVESGYVHECVLKRTTLQSWEDEFNNMGAAPAPLYDGDGLFPPMLSVHPNWVYNTGRVQAPWSDVLQPEGLKPPSHGTDADQDRDSASMPKATPSHGPKRARTDEAQASSSSSSAQPSSST